MPGKVVRVLVKPGDAVRGASADRGHRSDEDGKRAARRPRDGRVVARRSATSQRQGQSVDWRAALLRAPIDRLTGLESGEAALQSARAQGVPLRRSGPGVCGVILAVAIVSTLTIDLGPGVRRLAEREGSRRIERPIHIGGLAIHLLRGRVGSTRRHDRRPARRRSSVLHRRTHLGLARLVAGARRQARVHRHVGRVDRLADAGREVRRRHNFPQVREQRRSGPAARTAPVHDDAEVSPRVARAVLLRGSRDAVERRRAEHRPQHHQLAEVSRRGDVQRRPVTIQHYVPMWANMKARFTIDGSRLRLDRIDMETDGAQQSTAVGEVDLAHWPEQTYTVKSRVQFPRMRELFFENETLAAHRRRRLRRAFHLFKGGHDLAGRFTSEVAGVDDYRFPVAVRLAALDARPASTSPTPARGSTAATRGSGSRSSRSDRRRRRRPVRRDLHRRRSRGSSRISTSCAACGSPAARAGAICSSGRSAASASTAATARSTIAPPPGVETMTASLDGVARRRPGRLAHEWGPFAPPPLASAPADRRRASPIASTRTASKSRTAASRPSARTSSFDGDDRVGRRVAVPVPRHQPRLAGKRSGARRHPDRLRLAHRPGRVRRPRRVRRRHDRPFRRPRVEGRVHRRGPARLGHDLGRRLGAHRRREQLRDGHRRRRPARRIRRSAPKGCSRSAIRAATAARRSTRASASIGRDLDSLRHAFEIDD